MNIDPHIRNFWLQNYAVNGHVCTLCGGKGIIDTRIVKSIAGKHCGRLNWCICPPGQHYREESGQKFPE